MKIYYLILNYNTYQDTILVIDELNCGTVNFLVVDNCSPNGSYERLLEKYKDISNVEIIKTSDNIGFAKGNNFGLEYLAKYLPDYVCIINNDVHFDAKQVYRLAHLYDTLPNPGIISPIQKLPNGSTMKFRLLRKPTALLDCLAYCAPFLIPYHKYYENTQLSNIQEVYMIPGAYMFASYSILSKIGFMDSRTFLYCEERFLGHRVEKNGLHNYIVLNESYIHEHSKTISSEKSKKAQGEYLHEGRMIYSQTVRRDSKLTMAMLRLSRNLGIFLSSTKRFYKKILCK